MNFYSYRNASIGFIFAALLAGKYPKNRPMAIENPIEIIIPEMLGRAGYPKILEAVIPRTIPKIRPMNPPIRQILIASTINCTRIEEFLAPRAFLVPISLVLSVTDTSMIFITPIPPTKRAIPAIIEIAVVIVPKRVVSICTMPDRVRAVTL